MVVWDSEPAVPAARPADPARIGQHGLEIVKAVTEELLIEQEPLDKRITARIALHDLATRRPGRWSAGTAPAAEASIGSPSLRSVRLSVLAIAASGARCPCSPV